MTDFLLALLALNVAMWFLAWVLHDLPDPPVPAWLRRRTERRMRVYGEFIAAGLAEGLRKTYFDWKWPPPMPQ